MSWDYEQYNNTAIDKIYYPLKQVIVEGWLTTSLAAHKIHIIFIKKRERKQQVTFIIIKLSQKKL